MCKRGVENASDVTRSGGSGVDPACFTHKPALVTSVQAAFSVLNSFSSPPHHHHHRHAV